MSTKEYNTQDPTPVTPDAAILPVVAKLPDAPRYKLPAPGARIDVAYMAFNRDIVTALGDDWTLPNIPWSDEQLAIRAACVDPTPGHYAVISTAGSGKTTLIRACIADLKAQYEANVTSRTFHSHGMSVLKKAYYRTRVDDYRKPWEVINVLNAGYTDKGATKYDGILSRCHDLKAGRTPLIPRNWGGVVKDLASAGKFSGWGVRPYGGTAPQAFTLKEWQELSDRMGIDQFFPDKHKSCWPVVQTWVEDYLRQALKMAPSIIDFDDMLWVPMAVPEIRRMVPKFAWLFVDEAQDSNYIRRLWARESLKPNGRLMVVGDPDQAINGFAGADIDSMQRYVNEFEAATLTMATCRRCATEVVKYASQWSGHCVPAAGKELGTVTESSTDLFSFDLNPRRDVILCRNNRPLITLFFQLMKNGIPAVIKGNDVAKKMIKLLDQVATENDLRGRLEYIPVSRFNAVFEPWLKATIEKLLAEDRKGTAGYMSDLGGGVRVVISQMRPGATMSAVVEAITAMFEAKDGDKVDRLMLSSIHRSKGLEFDRVFWVGKNLYNPSKFAKSAADRKQEDNLQFVAATRAKYELHIIHMEKGQYDDD